MFVVFDIPALHFGGVYVPCILVEFKYLVFISCGCTPDGVYIPCIWWSLSTLYLYPVDVPLMEFMYLVFGGVYVPCISIP